MAKEYTYDTDTIDAKLAEIDARIGAINTGPTAPIEVAPTAPTMTDSDGTVKDTYTIPAKTGVIYEVDGVAKGAGTYPAPEGSAATIVAKPKTGYDLVGTTSWQFSWTNSQTMQVTTHTGVSTGRFSAFTKYGSKVFGNTCGYRITATETASGLVARFGNVDVKWNASTDPAPYTVAMSIKIDGVKRPFLFSGQPRAQVAQGAVVASDPLDVTIQKGQHYQVYVYTAVPEGSGQGWPRSGWDGIGGGRSASATDTGGQVTWVGSYSSPGADLTPEGAPEGYVASGEISYPLSITGRVDKPTAPSVAIWGDSISVATGDVSASGNDSAKDFAGNGMGYVIRWLRNDGSVGWSSYGIGGTYFDNFNQPGVLSRACGDVGSYYTHTICQWGINQFGSGSEAKSAAIRSWGILRDAGFPKIIQMTCTPYTNSADNWATAENQTKSLATNQANRDAWNEWLRDGAPMKGSVAAAVGSTDSGVVRAGDAGHPLFKILDAAAASETVKGSGLWTPGWTNEGLHPNEAGHAGMAAALPAPSSVLT